jgi:hypothetical protein
LIKKKVQVVDHHDPLPGFGDLGRVLALALDNPDHFLFEAIEKWERYHSLACRIAAEGRQYYERRDIEGYRSLAGGGLPDRRGQPDPMLAGETSNRAYPLVNSLLLALRYNAFGDHFLSDLFSAGHMRTPRADLMATFPPSEFNNDSLSVLTSGAKLDLASIVSGIHHDEDGRYGLWCELLLGRTRVAALSPTLPALTIDQFFARGDGHFLNPLNAVARDLCYRAVALSIRDVLFASLIGKDPRQAQHYWTPFGGDGGGARWAALRLVPKPLDHRAGWTGVAPEKRRGPDGAYFNHPPFAAPKDGSLKERWNVLRSFITSKGEKLPPR